MGGGQSNQRHYDDWDDDDDGVCKPCFLFKPPMSRRSDPMGTPLPETPIQDRRKRDAAMNRWNNEGNTEGVFSSQYFGIEKEVDPMSSAPSNGNNQAQVHEGNVRAAYLYQCRFCHSMSHKFSAFIGCRIADAKKVPNDGSTGCRFHVDMPPLR